MRNDALANRSAPCCGTFDGSADCCDCGSDGSSGCCGCDFGIFFGQSTFSVWCLATSYCDARPTLAGPANCDELHEPVNCGDCCELEILYDYCGHSSDCDPWRVSFSFPLGGAPRNYCGDLWNDLGDLGIHYDVL